MDSTSGPSPIIEPIIEPVIPLDIDDVTLDSLLNVSSVKTDQASLGQMVNIPSSNRVVVVSMLIDDSGSMRGMEDAVMEGLNKSIESFKGAKGSDFYVEVYGFKGTLFAGMIADVDGSSFEDYYPNYGETPLVTKAIAGLERARKKTESYRAMGISTTLAMLLLTDGRPNYDEYTPEDFKKCIAFGDYIVGMGIAPDNDDSLIMQFKDLFAKMGIEKKNIFTPSVNEAAVRHAIDQFSQSVSAIATR